MSQDSPYYREVYIGMAAIAGSVTALAFKNWKEMSPTEIILTLIVGFSFAWFVVPMIFTFAFGFKESDVKFVAGLTYISASGSNTLLPLAWRWLGRVFLAALGQTEEKR